MSDLFATTHTPAPDLDARIHVCAKPGCGKPGATCGVGNAWFCASCAPADFWPKNRGQP